MVQGASASAFFRGGQAFSPARCLPSPPIYLLYVDESVRADRDHYAVAGFAVHEQDAEPMAFALNDIADQLPDRERGAEAGGVALESGA